MATHRISVINHTTKIEPGVDVYPQDFTLLTGVGTRWPMEVLVFEDSSAREGFYGSFKVPQNYVNTADLVITWSTNTTANNPQFDWENRAVAPGEDLDAASQQSTLTGPGTVPGTAWFLVETTITLTDADFTAGDTVEYYFARDSLNDIHADLIAVIDVEFKYNDA